MHKLPDTDTFQDVLVELLCTNLSIDEVIEKLKCDPRLTDYTEYVQSFDADMVGVARELLTTWGKRIEDV